MARFDAIKSPVCRPTCGSFGSESLNHRRVLGGQENQDHHGGNFPMQRLASMPSAESCSPKQKGCSGAEENQFGKAKVLHLTTILAPPGKVVGFNGRYNRPGRLNNGP
jgi:hypothetical protein